MEQRNRYVFPATLSEAKRWFGLPRDEFVLYIPLCALTIFVNMWIFGPTVAAAFFGMRALKKGKGSSYMLSLAYWFLPTRWLRLFVDVLPESYKRHWIP